MSTRLENKQLLPVLKEMYLDRKLSVPIIARDLNISPFRIYNILKRGNIPRRTLKESSNINFQNKPLSFNLRKKLTQRELILKNSGILLYWCEGTKWQGCNNVDFVNSDVGMIHIYLRFLREICGVDEKRIRARIYCYSNQNPKELKKFWSQVTKISPEQFQKSYVRKDFRKDKIGKMKKGLIHICYADKKLLDLMRSWINEYSESWAGKQESVF